MNRRTFLAGAVTAIAVPLAGCAHPTDGSLSLRSMADDSAIAEQYAGATEGLPSERKSLIETAIAGEAPTREGLHPPYEGDRPVEYEGGYYQIDYEVVDTHVETLYDVRVDYDPAQSPSSVIDYADLPEVDRTALGELLSPPETTPEGEGYDMGRTYRYPEDADSALIGSEYDGVRRDGRTYRVAVEPNREVTVQTYEYRAEQVADSTADLARQLRERYLFTLSGLSEAERDIVADAIDGTYFPEGGVPDAFRSLADRFRAHEQVDADEHSGDWLVRYDGSVYWADLRYPPETDA